MSYFALSDWARRGSSSLATVGHYLPIPPSPFASESSASRPSQEDDDDDDLDGDDHHTAAGSKVEKLHMGYLAPSSPRGQYLPIDGERPRLHSRSPSSSSAGSSSAGSTRPRSWLARRDPVLIFVVLLSIATFVALLVAFPFPTTVHAFAAIFVGVTAWTQISCLRIVFALALVAWRGNPKALAKGLPRWSTAQYSFLLVLSTFVLYCLSLGLVPPLHELPALDRDLAGAQPGKYFIAANLYNNEDLVPHWSDQVVKLAEHRELAVHRVAAGLADPKAQIRSQGGVTTQGSPLFPQAYPADHRSRAKQYICVDLRVQLQGQDARAACRSRDASHSPRRSQPRHLRKDGALVGLRHVARTYRFPLGRA